VTVTSSVRRFALVDSLRGVAATAVVVFHLYEQNLLRHARAPFPEPFHTLFSHGYLGVYVFFVLSGFVIAHSIREERITGAFIGRFLLRRSLRLDPPYWAAILGAIAIAWVGQRSMETHQLTVPSITDVIAHVFYAQQFLGIPHILGVFWTLCLEIQFYLAYVLVLFASQRLTGGRLYPFFLPLFAIALAVSILWADASRALFVWAWPYFFLGVVTSWWCDRRIETSMWVLTLVASTLVAIDAPLEASVAIATALVLFVAARTPGVDGATQLHALTLGRVLQYLGRISYSLYLTHLLVGSKSARMVIRLLGGGGLGYAEMIAILGACILISIAAAHVMHVVVERPAHRLSRRVRLAGSRGGD
jgi:peptidoglycan/LPS O-acetylase OafA/YrhL